MPRDGIGALAPSPWAERLARIKRLRSKSRAADRRRRSVTSSRLAHAEHLLGQLIAGADVIGASRVDVDWRPRELVHVLVSIEARAFAALCALGAELEDFEPDVDDEPSEDAEPPLGWAENVDQTTPASGTDELEPSLGWTASDDQRRNGEDGSFWPHLDLELDNCDDEPNGDQELDLAGAALPFGLEAVMRREGALALSLAPPLAPDA